MDLLIGVYIDGARYGEARAQTAKVLKLDAANDVALYYQALIELRDPSGGDMGIARNDLSTVVNRNPVNLTYKQAYAEALQLSLIHISEPTRQAEISYAVFCLKK